MYPHNLLPEGWPIEVHLYGVLIAVGILAAFAIIIFYGRKLSVSEKMIDFIFFNGIASIAVGFGSAAVFQSFYDYIATGKFEFNGKITFIGGLIGGVSRVAAAEFSFFMAIPVMIGASLLKILKFVLAGFTAGGTELMLLAVGLIVSFLVSLFAIKFLMDFVKRHSFTPFGVYRIVLGALVLGYFLIIA